MLKVHQKIGTFRGDSALSSWIYRLTFNTAMSRLRSSSRSRASDHERERVLAADSGRESREQQPDWSSLPDEAMLRSQLREAVSGAISGLPEIYRAPIGLRDIESLTTQEAGRRLSLKDQKLKSRLHRGRLMPRDRLRQFEGGLLLHARAA